MFSVVFLTQST